jgi:hypothetical protein
MLTECHNLKSGDNRAREMWVGAVALAPGHVPSDDARNVCRYQPHYSHAS